MQGGKNSRRGAEARRKGGAFAPTGQPGKAQGENPRVGAITTIRVQRERTDQAA